MNADELNADMSSSFKGNPALSARGGRHSKCFEANLKQVQLRKLVQEWYSDNDLRTLQAIIM